MDHIDKMHINDDETTLERLEACYARGAAWESWDLPHVFDCSCGAGHVRIVGPRTPAELRAEGHAAQCARNMAARMRRFAIKAEACAEAAEECGEAAIVAATDGDWERARALAKEAMDIEQRVVPDAPSWGELYGEIVDALEHGIMVRCECGDVSGEDCDWVGPIDETVLIELARKAKSKRSTAPDRARLRAACADRVISQNSAWSRVPG